MTTYRIETCIVLYCCTAGNLSLKALERLFYVEFFCIVLHCIVLYCIVLYCIALHCIALHCIVLYCIVLYCIVLYCIVLYCIVLYCIVLYCIVLYCIVLYCIVLYCIVFGNISYAVLSCIKVVPQAILLLYDKRIPIAILIAMSMVAIVMPCSLNRVLIFSANEVSLSNTLVIVSLKLVIWFVSLPLRRLILSCLALSSSFSLEIRIIMSSRMPSSYAPG